MFTRCVHKMCVQDSQNFVSQDMLTRHPVVQDTFSILTRHVGKTPVDKTPPQDIVLGVSCQQI